MAAHKSPSPRLTLSSDSHLHRPFFFELSCRKWGFLLLVSVGPTVVRRGGLKLTNWASGSLDGTFLINCIKHRDFEQHSAEAFDQRSQSWLWHHWDEFIEHGSLTKQRMRALFGGVGFEMTVISESLPCSSEQCQQDDGKSIQQPKPVPSFRRANSYRSHPHAKA